MDTFYPHAILYAIGWAILHSFWQMALAWMMFQALFGFRKGVNPSLRYLGAVSLLGLGALMFLVTGWYEYDHALSLGRILSEMDTARSIHRGPSTGWISIADRWGTWLEKFMPYLSSAYLMVLFLLGVRLWGGWLHTRSIRHDGLIALDASWTDEVKDIARNLGLEHVRIYLSEKLVVPVTLGHFRPLILLPVASLNYLTIDQARAVLLHEIAHIHRRDYLINICVSVVETILFFNPFVHTLGTSLRRDREMCCDDFVLRYQEDPGSYVRALMHLEQYRSGVSPAMALAATGTKGQLINRVKRILDIHQGRGAYGQRLAAFLCLAGLLCALAWMAPDALKGPAWKNMHASTVAQSQSSNGQVQVSVTGNPVIQPEIAGVLRSPGKKASEARPRQDEDSHPLHFGPMAGLESHPADAFLETPLPPDPETNMGPLMFITDHPDMTDESPLSAPTIDFDIAYATEQDRIRSAVSHSIRKMQSAAFDNQSLQQAKEALSQLQHMMLDKQNKLKNEKELEKQLKVLDMRDLTSLAQRPMDGDPELIEFMAPQADRFHSSTAQKRQTFRFVWPRTAPAGRTTPAAGKAKTVLQNVRVEVGAPQFAQTGSVIISDVLASNIDDEMVNTVEKAGNGHLQTPLITTRVRKGVSTIRADADNKTIRIILEHDPKDIEIQVDRQ